MNLDKDIEEFEKTSEKLGTYIELFMMHPEWKNFSKSLNAIWEDWSKGTETVEADRRPAQKELLNYILSVLRRR